MTLISPLIQVKRNSVVFERDHIKIQLLVNSWQISAFSERWNNAKKPNKYHH